MTGKISPGAIGRHSHANNTLKAARAGARGFETGQKTETIHAGPALSGEFRMNLIAENWALSGSPDHWVVVNGIPGEMNYGNMIANGFRSKDEALEFIRLAASNPSVLRMPLPQIIQ